MTALLICVAVFAFGAIVVGRLRARRRWSGPSLSPSELAGREFEEPAAGGSTAGAETNTTDSWAVAQAEARVTNINSSSVVGGL